MFGNETAQMCNIGPIVADSKRADVVYTPQCSVELSPTVVQIMGLR